MKKEIKVPNMGESITEAYIGVIIKPTGSMVAMDDEILELETDKVNQVLYAPQAGVVNLNVKSEDTVKIGQVIGNIDSKGIKLEKKAEKRTEEKPPPPKKEKVEGVRISKEEHVEKMFAEPKDEVSQPKQGLRGEKRQKMTKIRKIIADRLLEVKQSTAMLTTFNEVDLSDVIKIRAKYKDQFLTEYDVRLGFMSFFIKATVSALATFPELNSYIDEDEIVLREYFDIGIAVSTDRGLVVPVLRDCDKLSFVEIEKGIENYAKKAREGSLIVDDLIGGGFTITNGGVFGSLLSTPILNPYQCGILGTHKIEKRAVVVDDQVVIRPMMYLALSYDHRIIDGKAAVSFLVHIKNCLEDPTRLLLGV